MDKGDDNDDDGPKRLGLIITEDVWLFDFDKECDVTRDIRRSDCSPSCSSLSSCTSFCKIFSLIDDDDDDDDVFRFKNNSILLLSFECCRCWFVDADDFFVFLGFGVSVSYPSMIL
jgi:hypothetical protein